MIAMDPLIRFLNHPSVIELEKDRVANLAWAKRYIALRKCLLLGPRPSLAGDMDHFPPLGPTHA
jgi:hypothetical protein